MVCGFENASESVCNNCLGMYTSERDTAVCRSLEDVYFILYNRSLKKVYPDFKADSSVYKAQILRELDANSAVKILETAADSDGYMCGRIEEPCPGWVLLGDFIYTCLTVSPQRQQSQCSDELISFDLGGNQLTSLDSNGCAHDMFEDLRNEISVRLERIWPRFRCFPEGEQSPSTTHLRKTLGELFVLALWVFIRRLFTELRCRNLRLHPVFAR